MVGHRSAVQRRRGAAGRARDRASAPTDATRSARVCAVSVGILAVWLLSRTLGLPFGPDTGDAEAVGWLDLATGLDEALLVVLLATHAGWAPWRKRGRVAFYCQAGGIGLALLLTMAFASGAGH
ncbi:MAG: hypothetical protein H0W96_00085 [Solirubrobacterales bacterium]|nr:hypothetical protein [Solirubrobacterales bacterium]